ncbi:MAG: hypothetical protein EXR99_11990 [Gemmataceae bacterium]|nr:hypothetical protein [Gemmataceae bacterium]
MRIDLNKVAGYAQNACTEELLDRVTLWRQGMEADALQILEMELAKRGITFQEVQNHAEQWSGRVARDASGLPLVCKQCPRPATVIGWSWVRILGLLPLFPRRCGYCDTHKPG